MTTTVDQPSTSTAPDAWPRAQRTLVFALAALTAVSEVLSLTTDVRPHLGAIPLSLSLVPSLMVLVALGARSRGEVVDPARLVPFWLGVGGTYLFGWALWARDDEAGSIVGLAVAAINEEVVYRFAVPLLLTTGLLLLRVPGSVARVTGYVVAGAWWVLLPGHRAQTDSPAMLLTFVAFAAVSAIVVARSRALLPMGLAHGALNIITLAQLRGDIDPGLRGILASCLVFLLVGTFAWPGDEEERSRRRVADGVDGDRIDDLVGDVVIDLRDDVRPAVHRGGVVTYLDEAPDSPPVPTPVPAPVLGPPVGPVGPVGPAPTAEPPVEGDPLDSAGPGSS